MISMRLQPLHADAQHTRGRFATIGRVQALFLDIMLFLVACVRACVRQSVGW